MEAAREANKLAPQDPQTWSILGSILAHLGQKEEAVQWLCKAWQVRHTFPDVQEAEKEITEAFILIGLTPAVCNTPPADEA